MWCILVRTVYFVKCSNWRIKNESNKNWIDSVYKEILWGTQKQKYKETNQVNRHSQEEPVGAIFVCFLSIFSNPIHQTRATFHTAQRVLTLPFKSELLRTKGTLRRVDRAPYLLILWSWCFCSFFQIQRGARWIYWNLQVRAFQESLLW